MRKGLRRGNLRERDQFEERPRWQDNIKICLRDVGWKGVACSHLA